MNNKSAKSIGAPCASLDLKKVLLSDRDVIDELLLRFPQRISGFTFAALYSWNPVYRYEWTHCGLETLLISCLLPADGKRHFLQPVGNFGPDAQRLFLEALKKSGYPMKIYGVSSDFIRNYPEFLTHFDVENDPGLANYIYRASDLAALEGKFYAKKRNLIAQARKLYQWTVHPLTAENSLECLEVLDQLDTTHNDFDQTLKNEDVAVREAIAHFSELGQQGILIRVDGKAAAFTLYEALTPEMAVVHFEKAARHYKGLYQIVNQETAKAIAAAGFSSINREEDLGIPGLRQAKLSYGPLETISSYTLLFKAI